MTIPRLVPRPFLALLVLGLASSHLPAARAQAVPAGLQRRMNAFTTALRRMEPMVRIAGFFPRQGEWELIEAPVNAVAPGIDATLRHRVAADSTLAAISEGSDICDEFGGVTGDVGAYEGTLVMTAMYSRRPWRYVGHLRFVSPGSSAAGPIYVEWRREAGAWVVSRIGAAYWYFPKVAGRLAGSVMTRDTMEGRWLAAERRFATPQPWFRDRRPILLGDGPRYLEYGLPRQIDDSLLMRFGSIGVVPVFIEPAADHERPEVVYVLTGPGEYQPYQRFGNSVCRVADD